MENLNPRSTHHIVLEKDGNENLDFVRSLSNPQIKLKPRPRGEAYWVYPY